MINYCKYKFAGLLNLSKLVQITLNKGIGGDK
jgi:hypothetical protein